MHLRRRLACLALSIGIAFAWPGCAPTTTHNGGCRSHCTHNRCEGYDTECLNTCFEACDRVFPPDPGAGPSPKALASTPYVEETDAEAAEYDRCLDEYLDQRGQ